MSRLANLTVEQTAGSHSVARPLSAVSLDACGLDAAPGRRRSRRAAGDALRLGADTLGLEYKDGHQEVVLIKGNVRT